MKLDTAASDRILDAVRPFLPQEVEVKRVRERKLVIKFKAPGIRASSSSAAFGHISARSNPAEAVAVGLTSVVRQVDRLFKSHDLRWPGHEWGPTTIKARAQDGLAYVTITDVAGNVVEVGPVEPTSNR